MNPGRGLITPAAGKLLPVAALMVNAFVWGVSWWPFRLLQAQGLHPLWTTAIIYTLSVGAISLWRPAAWKELATQPSLWLIVIGAGTTNSTFNWGVTFGDVVRVVLLFYLVPVWTALMARWILNEPITAAAVWRIAAGLAGAAIVLWPADGAFDASAGPGFPDLLGILGGLSFAFNNVMLRRLAARSQAARALAMFFGGALVSALVASSMAASGRMAWPATLDTSWMLFAGVVGVAFLGANLALQYGVTRLPANVTSVVMLTEVLFASGSAALLGAASLTPQLLIGGGLIVGAALMASLSPRPATASPHESR